MKSVAIVGLAAALIATPATAQEADRDTPQANDTQVEFALGVDFEEGHYGTGQNVRSYSAPATVIVRHKRLSMVASLPYRRIEADGTGPVVGDGVLGLPLFQTEQPGSGKIVREGMGDLTLSAGYALPMKAVNLSVNGTVKLPTADEGLGTGETDYAVGADISKDIGGIIPFAGVTYTMPGRPDGFDLKNSVAVNGGVAAQVSRNARAFVAYQDSANINDGLPDGQRIVSGVNLGLRGGLSLGAYGSAGISAGAPDLATGLRIGIALP